MSSSPQSRPPWRYPRAHLDGNNPIVLRVPNGQRIGANLQVISVTGGLLSLSKSVDQGSRVRLMFLTEAGSVLGGAEMLPPSAIGCSPSASFRSRQTISAVSERSSGSGLKTNPSWLGLRNCALRRRSTTSPPFGGSSSLE